MGAVEHCNAALGRGLAVDAPEEVVVALFRGRALEAGDLAGLRIESAHHVLDGAVLAAGVYGLQHDEQGALPFGVKLLLQQGHMLQIGDRASSVRRRCSCRSRDDRPDRGPSA